MFHSGGKTGGGDAFFDPMAPMADGMSPVCSITELHSAFVACCVARRSERKFTGSFGGFGKPGEEGGARAEEGERARRPRAIRCALSVNVNAMCFVSSRRTNSLREKSRSQGATSNLYAMDYAPSAHGYHTGKCMRPESGTKRRSFHTGRRVLYITGC